MRKTEETGIFANRLKKKGGFISFIADYINVARTRPYGYFMSKKGRVYMIYR
jgi:hypothetical protein